MNTKIGGVKGHLASNGGICGHSAGEYFPFIVYAKGIAPTTWHIRHPNGTALKSFFKTAKGACDFALHAKNRWLAGHL